MRRGHARTIPGGRSPDSESRAIWSRRGIPEIAVLVHVPNLLIVQERHAHGRPGPRLPANAIDDLVHQGLFRRSQVAHAGHELDNLAFDLPVARLPPRARA